MSPLRTVHYVPVLICAEAGGAIGGEQGAGDIIQMFVDHRRGIAVIGDNSLHSEAGSPLRDFAHECNRGQRTWLLADAEELGSGWAPRSRGSG
ncbi:DUF4180 domain-containing protein [Streptomyces pulveraceus]|uniref:DUF4180 domain-containing protein n=1 Tax=Streptomyces pulveraceus TaxID=68258 RepID=A0ABW1GSS8_9ACTN